MLLQTMSYFLTNCHLANYTHFSCKLSSCKLYLCSFLQSIILQTLFFFSYKLSSCKLYMCYFSCNIGPYPIASSPVAQMWTRRSSFQFGLILTALPLTQWVKFLSPSYHCVHQRFLSNHKCPCRLFGDLAQVLLLLQTVILQDARTFLANYHLVNCIYVLFCKV